MVMSGKGKSSILILPCGRCRCATSHLKIMLESQNLGLTTRQPA